MGTGKKSYGLARFSKVQKETKVFFKMKISVKATMTFSGLL